MRSRTCGRRVARAVGVALVVGLALAGCGGTDAVEGGTATDATTTPATQSPAPTSPSPAPGPNGSASPVPTTASPDVPSTTASSATPADATSDPTGDPVWEGLAAGLDEPAAMLVDPRTGEDLVVELGGRVVRLDGSTVLNLSDRVVRRGERGLLDAAVTPGGDAVIVHYSGADDGRTVVSRLPVLPEGDLADPGDEQVLLELAQPASNHNGGSVVFGADGLLYVGLGDGGRANDAFGNGADPGTPLGAILRLDVTSQPGEVVIPDDNPFVDGGGDDRVWAHGLRNPWRIATDGESWYVADVGQDAVEEVTVVPATAGPHDLAWPDWEGDFCRVEACDRQPLPPVATLTHADGACSIIGMAVAERPAIDAGAVFWTDFCDTRVWRLDTDGSVVGDARLPDGIPAYALDVDADGFVVALTTDGRILRRTRS